MVLTRALLSPTQFEEGERRYREALFEKGCAYDLGLCHKDGHGVPRDHAQAVHWYRKAAEQGNEVAERNLGFCYVHGRSVSENPVEACKWFRLAADQGDSRAKEELAALSTLMSPTELAETERLYEEYSKRKQA
jgi:TPR repeat protein